MDFIDTITRAFDNENATNTCYKTKDDLLKSCKGTVLFHKTHVNDELFSIPKDGLYTNLPEKLHMITICVLVMAKEIFISKPVYIVHMYIAEIAKFSETHSIQRDFLRFGLILKTKEYRRAKDLIFCGVPDWPDRKTTDHLHPEIILNLPEVVTHHPEQKSIDDLVEDIEPIVIPKKKKSKKKKKKKGFDAAAAIAFLRSRWLETEEEFSERMKIIMAENLDNTL